MKPIPMRTTDATWLDLRKPHRFQEFFSGLLEYLKAKLQRVTVAGSHEYFTCGQLHERWNHQWKPFQHLWAYCEKTGHDFYEAKDMIEERIGRNLICECELLNDEKAIRRNSVVHLATSVLSVSLQRPTRVTSPSLSPKSSLPKQTISPSATTSVGSWGITRSSRILLFSSLTTSV